MRTPAKAPHPVHWPWLRAMKRLDKERARAHELKGCTYLFEAASVVASPRPSRAQRRSTDVTGPHGPPASRERRPERARGAREGASRGGDSAQEESLSRNRPEG